MINGSVDYGLQVTYQLHLFVLKSYIPQPYLPCQRYELFFVLPYHCYNLIALVSTRPSISTSSCWSRCPTRHMQAKQAIRFDPWLTKKDYLQTNAFANLVVVEQEEYLHALQKKATGGKATSKVVKRRLVGHGQA